MPLVVITLDGKRWRCARKHVDTSTGTGEVGFVDRDASDSKDMKGLEGTVLVDTKHAILITSDSAMS